MKLFHSIIIRSESTLPTGIVAIEIAEGKVAREWTINEQPLVHLCKEVREANWLSVSKSNYAELLVIDLAKIGKDRLMLFEGNGYLHIQNIFQISGR